MITEASICLYTIVSWMDDDNLSVIVVILDIVFENEATIVFNNHSLFILQYFKCVLYIDFTGYNACIVSYFDCTTFLRLHKVLFN